MLLNIIIWILLGAPAGWVASTLTKHETQMGLIANIIVGITGAFIGGFLIKMSGASDIAGFTRYGMFMALLGAGLLLFLLNIVRRMAKREGQRCS
jgi:uncharacterized membrane protein YeaQ/YmgE (transglycosylase-associated protein family)